MLRKGASSAVSPSAAPPRGWRAALPLCLGTEPRPLPLASGTEPWSAPLPSMESACFRPPRACPIGGPRRASELYKVTRNPTLGLD